ncbi:hypothetical protein B0H11DRAFT_1635690, partial [Mycena galericulata]
VRNGYIADSESVLRPVIEKPTSFPQFQERGGLLYCKNTLGESVLCIPRTTRKKGSRLMSEMILDQSHTMLGHYGELRTSEYIRRWYRW